MAMRLQKSDIRICCVFWNCEKDDSRLRIYLKIPRLRGFALAAQESPLRGWIYFMIGRAPYRNQ